jgi:peptide/nickel transport system ATP-binding protein
MSYGQIVEEGPTSQIVTHPQHDYTRALLSAAPAFNWFSENRSSP